MKTRPVSQEVSDYCATVARMRPKSAVVLYGSQARGDSTKASDVDILLIGDKAFSRERDQNVCISRYPADLLSRFASDGALFALHLFEEGIVYSDPYGHFEKARAKYQAPVSYLGLRAELSRLANVLDVDVDQYQKSPAWLNRVGLYVLRSALFAKFAENGTPTFSMRGIAQALGDEGLLEIYARKYKGRTSFAEFMELKSYVENILDSCIVNESRSLVDYILEQSKESKLVSAFGSRLRELSDHPDLPILMADYALGNTSVKRCSS